MHFSIKKIDSMFRFEYSDGNKNIIIIASKSEQLINLIKQNVFNLIKNDEILQRKSGNRE